MRIRGLVALLTNSCEALEVGPTSSAFGFYALAETYSDTMTLAGASAGWSAFSAFAWPPCYRRPGWANQDNP